jgi:hypothetical protein
MMEKQKEDEKLDKILVDLQKIIDNTGEGKIIIFIKDSIITGWQTVCDIKIL